MTKRPRSITVIGWLFIIVGGVTFLSGVLPRGGPGAVGKAAELRAEHPVDDMLINVVRMLAVLGGGFVLRGRNWARWLLVVWMVFHIVVGALHSPWSLVVHGVLFGVIGYCLFRPEGQAYFRGAGN